MDTPGNDDTAVLLALLVLVACCCCCSSSSFLVTGGLLFTKKDDDDDEDEDGEDDDDDDDDDDEDGEKNVGTLRNSNSGPQNDGEGKVYYLDRHNINCEDSPLNSFKFTRPSNTTTQYNYSCVDGIKMSTTEKHTLSNHKGPSKGKESSTLYLDRHTLDCSDKPITQFILKRDNNGKNIYYTYKCGNTTTNSPVCRETNTTYNTEHNSTHYLDRHDVKCEKDEYISKFKLQRDGSGNFRYDYKCCKHTL